MDTEPEAGSQPVESTQQEVERDMEDAHPGSPPEVSRWATWTPGQEEPKWLVDAVYKEAYRREGRALFRFAVDRIWQEVNGIRREIVAFDLLEDSEDELEIRPDWIREAISMEASIACSAT